MSKQSRPRSTRSTDRYHDGYNSVDRNIYSSARRPPARRKKKRSGPLKKAVTALLVLVLLVGGGMFAYFKIMAARMDRSDNTDTKQYEEQPSAAPAWDVISDDKVINILLIGMDSGDDGLSSRSDASMLISIDNKQKQLKMVSFLRDMYLDIPTVGKNKLNAAFSYGGQALLRQTIENNFRVDIDKFIGIDFENFSSLVEKMGGVDVNLTMEEANQVNYDLDINRLKEGMNTLNGKEALQFARIRYIDNDFGRTGRQRQLLQCMLQKLKTMNPAQLHSFAYDFLPNVKTNLSDGDLVYLLGAAGSIMGYDMKTMHIPNDNTFTELQGVPNVGDVLKVDLTENSRLLREFLYGDGGANSSKTTQ